MTSSSDACFITSNADVSRVLIGEERVRIIDPSGENAARHRQAELAATSHQRRSGTWWVDCVRDEIKDQLGDVGQRQGHNAATTRDRSPNRTTPGPDSQTILRRAGRCGVRQPLLPTAQKAASIGSQRLAFGFADSDFRRQNLPADCPSKRSSPTIHPEPLGTRSLMKTLDLRLVRNAAGGRRLSISILQNLRAACHVELQEFS